MDLRLLRVFKTVVDCGGMAAAELELNIGTSTVSRHVKDLEVRLGLTLCRRGRAGFALTPEGQSRSTPRRCACWPATDAFRAGVDDIHRAHGRPADGGGVRQDGQQPGRRASTRRSPVRRAGAGRDAACCTWAASRPSSAA
jgi:hypothetical protein